jgi:GTP-binding protein
VNPVFLKSAAAPADCPADEGLEVAIVGRSNSGKSSAINRIAGRKKLARVSKTPGRTRLLNFFELAPGRRLVDLPGYGFAAVPEAVRADWRGLLEGYFATRRSLRGLVVTVDARRGLMDLDELMLAWAARLGVPVLLLLTKVDKLSRGAGLAARRRVAIQAGQGVGVELFSALEGTGVEAARAQLAAWLEL